MGLKRLGLALRLSNRGCRVKAKYKNGDLPLIKGKIYNVKIIYDDCDYVQIKVENGVKGIYYNKKEMEKEWEVIKDEL